jgi:hypothetical protein
MSGMAAAAVTNNYETGNMSPISGREDFSQNRKKERYKQTKRKKERYTQTNKLKKERYIVTN